MTETPSVHDVGALEEQFLEHLWPPLTQMQGLKPVINERGEGAVVYDAHGKAYVDAFASLWTVNVGHGRQEIIDAIAAQGRELACYHMFGIAKSGNSSHPPRAPTACEPPRPSTSAATRTSPREQPPNT